MTADNLKKLGLSSSSDFPAPALAQFANLSSQSSADNKATALEHVFDNLQNMIKKDKTTQGALKPGTSVTFTTRTGDYMVATGAPVLYYNNTAYKGTKSGNTYSYTIAGMKASVTVNTSGNRSAISCTIPADLVKVQFNLYNKKDGYYLTATGEDGLYYATGEAKDEKDATLFSPAASGSLVIKGLEADTYDLTEVKTDKGYSLLKGKITIEIYCTEQSITPSVACLTGSESDHTEIVDVLSKEAFAIVDNTSAKMSADGVSANALVDLSIQNNRDFELPKTGGAGTWMITICGVIGVAGGVFLLRKGKRSANGTK
jgi:LPXTG-motif cell wall-anchored protein